MKKYSLFLVPLLLGVWFEGCESACCGPVTEKKSDPKPADQNPPVAQINLSGALNGECTPGDTVTLTPASTDSDGTVTENIWKVDGVVVGNTAVTCPDAGESKTICLKAVDNDGLESQEVCTTITGKAAEEPQLKLPIINLKKGFTDQDGILHDAKGFVGCEDIRDQDAINTDGIDNPYGADHAIKEINWHIEYTGRAASDWTQTDWNNEPNPFKAGDCGKWLDDAHLPATINVTPVDDDDQSKTYIFIMDVNGDITPVVE